MGLEIKITGSTPLESMSTLTAAAMYCMQIPAVADAAKTMVESADSAMKPGPHSTAAASANTAIPGYQTPPVNAPASIPSVTTAPADQPPTAPQTPPTTSVPNPMSTAPVSNPWNAVPVNAQGGAPVNPPVPGIGSNSTMMTQTSLFNPVPGNSIPVSNAPGFTVAQISKAGADLVTANPAKRAELNAFLRQYGVQALNELKPEQLGSFALALRGLGANI